MSDAGLAPTPAAQLSACCKAYCLGLHTVTGIHDVSVTIARGEMVALTGPSGSGKTTLLNLLGLLDTPDKGLVILGGKDMSHASEHDRTLARRDHLGFIFQGFNLIPVMTAEQNVDYPLFVAGVPANERKHRVAEQLAAVGLENHVTHLPDALSGGQRQRVAVARALVKHPLLVIADEPTASLDSVTSDQILTLMRSRCRDDGVAFLIATHDLSVASRCDRVITVRDGTVIQ